MQRERIFDGSSLNNYVLKAYNLDFRLNFSCSSLFRKYLFTTLELVDPINGIIMEKGPYALRVII